MNSPGIYPGENRVATKNLPPFDMVSKSDEISQGGLGRE